MPKIRKKSPIHENADANITCDFGDGDISPYRSRLPHGHIVSSITVRCYSCRTPFKHDPFAFSVLLLNSDNFLCLFPGLSNKNLRRLEDALDSFYKLHAIMRNSPQVIYQIADMYPLFDRSSFAVLLLWKISHSNVC